MITTKAKSDLFADKAEVAGDLTLLESVRWARKEFVDQVCAASAKQDERLLAALRLEPTYQLAEFYYSLRAWHIETGEDIGRLAELHNQYIVDLTKDESKLRRLGLTRERALDAMLTGDIMPRLVQNWCDSPGALDQSNLARLLAGVMSTETCRKTVVACSDAGFLQRTKTPYGTILVTSDGRLESIFGTCIRDLRLRLSKER